jgi:hypothetical protein
MIDHPNLRKVQTYGRLKTLGFVGRWADEPNGEKYDRYLCKCACGRKVQVKLLDLKSGEVYSCPSCKQLGPEVRKPHSEKEQKRGEYEDAKSQPTPVNNELILRLLIYRKQVPDWWWRCLGTVIDQMCQMDGRKRYSDEEICRYFECPQQVLNLIRKYYDVRIKRITRDYQRIEKQFDYIEKIPSEMLPEGVFNHFYHVAIINTTKRYKGDNRDV